MIYQAVGLFRRHLFSIIVLAWLAALTLVVIGLPGSSWDACEDARIRRQTARTDGMFGKANRDVALFCPPEEAAIRATNETPEKTPLIRRIKRGTPTPEAVGAQ